MPDGPTRTALQTALLRPVGRRTVRRSRCATYSAFATNEAVVDRPIATGSVYIAPGTPSHQPHGITASRIVTVSGLLEVQSEVTSPPAECRSPPRPVSLCGTGWSGPWSWDGLGGRQASIYTAQVTSTSSVSYFSLSSFSADSLKFPSAPRAAISSK